MSQPILRLYYSKDSNNCKIVANQLSNSKYTKIVQYISVDNITKVPSFVKGVPTIYAKNNKGQEIVFKGKRECLDFIQGSQKQKAPSHQQYPGEQPHPSQQQPINQQQSQPPTQSLSVDSTGLETYSSFEMGTFDTSYASVTGESLNQNQNPFNSYQQINTPTDNNQTYKTGNSLNYNPPQIKKSQNIPNFALPQHVLRGSIGEGGMINRQNYNPDEFNGNARPDPPVPNFQDPVQHTKGNSDVDNSFDNMMKQRDLDNELFGIR